MMKNIMFLLILLNMIILIINKIPIVKNTNEGMLKLDLIIMDTPAMM